MNHKFIIHLEIFKTYTDNQSRVVKEEVTSQAIEFDHKSYEDISYSVTVYKNIENYGQIMARHSYDLYNIDTDTLEHYYVSTHCIN